MACFNVARGIASVKVIRVAVVARLPNVHHSIATGRCDSAGDKCEEKQAQKLHAARRNCRAGSIVDRSSALGSMLAARRVLSRAASGAGSTLFPSTPSWSVRETFLGRSPPETAARLDVHHVARLALLRVDAAEAAALEEQVRGRLAVVSLLDECPTDNVEPLSGPLDDFFTLPLRDDVVGEMRDAADVLANARDTSPPYFRTKA